MKKLVLVAGLFIAFTTNAQQRNEGFRDTKVEFHQKPERFRRIKIVSASGERDLCTFKTKTDSKRI
jgi:hypothetical protein